MAIAQLTSTNNENATACDAPALLKALNATTFAADSANTRYTLGVLAIEPDGTLVATDGRRLAAARLPELAAIEEPTGSQLPLLLHIESANDLRKALTSKSRGLTLRVMCRESEELKELAAARKSKSDRYPAPRIVRATFEKRQKIEGRMRWAPVTIDLDIVEGKFPKWRDITPAPAGNATMISGKAKALRELCEKTQEERNRWEFELFPNGKGLTATQPAESIEVSAGGRRDDLAVHLGAETAVGINPALVIPWLNALNDDLPVTWFPNKDDGNLIRTPHNDALSRFLVFMPMHTS